MSKVCFQLISCVLNSDNEKMIKFSVYETYIQFNWHGNVHTKNVLHQNLDPRFSKWLPIYYLWITMYYSFGD